MVMALRRPNATLILRTVANELFIGGGESLRVARDAVTTSRRPAAEHSAGLSTMSLVAAGC